MTKGAAGRIILALVLVLLQAYGCSDDPISPPSAPGAQNPLQVVIDDYRETNFLKGISAAVIMPGRDVWTGVSGESHDGVDITPGMLLPIGSITKTYVAVVVLQLVEEGLLSLDDTINDWLPDLQQYLPTPDNIDMGITARQLLNHTSGIYNYLDSNVLAADMAADPGKIWTPEELLAYVASPVFAPGGGFFYTNTGYLLLGLIIRETTGSARLSTEIAGRILTPGVFDTTFVDAASLSEMKTTVYVREGFEYGLGVVRAVMAGGRVMWGHSGLAAGFTAVVLHSPADKTTVAVIANYSDAILEPLVDRLMAVVEKEGL